MRRRTFRAVLAMMVTCLAAVAWATPASASPWVSVWVQSSFADACASVPSSADGVSPTQESCVDVGSQLWTFDDAGIGGTYRIRNVGTGKCLAANGLVSGSPVQQFPCASTTSQRWTLNGSGNTFRIVSVSSGHCLARTDTVLGSPLVHGTCTLLRAQWTLYY